MEPYLPRYHARARRKLGPGMRRLSNLWRNLIRKQRVEDQLDAEVRSYLELLEEEKIRKGLEPRTAHREALIELGGIEQVKESVRDARAGRLVEMLWSDVRHAWRMILKMPLTAAVVAGSLGVGIGVNATVFSWIQAVVFEPLPGVSGSGGFQLVEPRADTGSYPGMSWLEYRDLRESMTSFRDLLAFRMVPFYVGDPGRTDRIYGLLISGNYFAALGLQPALGRFIQPEEAARPGGAPVVVISYEFWQTHFGATPVALGQSLRVNDRPLTIVGVAPPRFQGTVLGMNFSLWTPATLAPLLLAGSEELEDRSLRGYSAMGRLAPHASRAAAQAELDRALRQLAQLYPETNAKIQGEVMPFWRAPRGPQRLLANSLAILEGILLLLLLAVCGNAANLMLARTAARQREIGVRLAIGAGPGRVVSLLLTENLLLAFLGAGLGLLVAFWGTVALRAVPMIGSLPLKFQTRVDAIGLVFTMSLGLASGLIFGVSPAVALARLDPHSVLRGTPGTGIRARFRNTLIGTQTALALLVLIAAGLFFRSFRETQATDPGFLRDGVLLAAYDLTGRSADSASARAFAARLLERVRALPAVEGAAIASAVPLDIHGMPLTVITVEGHARRDAAPDRALTNTVTPGYFSVMAIPFRAGRDFADLNDPAAPPQAIVNEEFVHRYLNDIDPIGRRVTIRGRSCLITGVVRNSVYESFGERATPLVYRSYRDRPQTAGEIHIRTRAGSETMLASGLRQIVRELDPTLNVYDIRTMNEHVDRNAFLRRIPARMFAVLGPLLLALAAVGIYATAASSVAQRTTEIAVRLALGASARRVVGQIVRETLRVVAGGALAGWLVAVLVDIHLAGGAIYVPVFIGVPAILLLVATLACWLPAFRAGKIDPLVALKQE
jgi:macrolide transport system ATP-binding/permease protein